MVRRFEAEEIRTFRPLYWAAVLFIAVIWIWAFKLYFDRYEYLHPDVTWAVPGVETQLVKIPGVLLWKEVPLVAKMAGTVSYPQGTGPVRVSHGSVVARIVSGGRAMDIKAYRQGYFVAGVDGEEISWRYSAIWPGDKLPVPHKLSHLKDGLTVGPGQAIGKLVEQPQELRFVGYAKIRGNIADQIKNRSLMVKMDMGDTVTRAAIRVWMDVGDQTKFYVTLPWFQPETLLSRKYTLTVEAGRTEGALVPASAVLDKDGMRGVYLVRGSRVIFQKAEGKAAANGKFLVTKGISVGDAVVEDASTAREGRIQLW